MALSASAQDEGANPFAPPAQEARLSNGYVLLSDGRRADGFVHLTPGVLLRIYDREQRVHVDVPFEMVRQIDVEVEKSWLDQEWRFKEAGSPQKVFTDRFYWSHKYVCTVHLSDGTKIHGDLNAVVYVETPDGKKEKYFLRKYYTGSQGTRDDVPEIVYVQRVVIFSDDGQKGNQ